MSLFWQGHPVDNFGGFVNLGERKLVIEGKLRDMGFTNTAINDFEVAGDRPGTRLSIAHFAVTNTRHHEVVMAGGDDPGTKIARDQVVEMLGNLHPL